MGDIRWIRGLREKVRILLIKFIDKKIKIIHIHMALILSNIYTSTPCIAQHIQALQLRVNGENECKV